MTISSGKITGDVKEDYVYYNDGKLKTVFLDYAKVKNSSLALSLAKRETIRMGQLVQNMTGDIIIPFFSYYNTIGNYIVNKGQTVVQAVAEGKKAAEAIIKYLENKS